MNFARITIISVVIFGVCLCDIGVKAQTEPISLKIEIDHSSVQIGSDIPVKVLLTNNTAQVIPGSKVRTAGDSSFQYKVNVEREDHAAVAKKYAEKRRRHEVAPDPLEDGSVILLHIQPRETDKDIVFVSNRYEFDKPGEYFVQVEYELPESLGGGVIKSNTITITVTP